MRLIVLIPGSKRTISCLETPSGRRPAEEFLYGLPDAGARIAAVLDHLAEHGTLRSPEKFKKLAGTDGIWELRHREARILCFHHAEAHSAGFLAYARKRIGTDRAISAAPSG